MAQRMSVDCGKPINCKSTINSDRSFRSGLDRPPDQLESEDDWMHLKLFYCLYLMDSILVIGSEFGMAKVFGRFSPVLRRVSWSAR